MPHCQPRTDCGDRERHKIWGQCVCRELQLPPVDPSWPDGETRACRFEPARAPRLLPRIRRIDWWRCGNDPLGRTDMLKSRTGTRVHNAHVEALTQRIE